MRKEMLSDGDMKERVLEQVEELCDEFVDEYAPEKVYPEEWDMVSLKNRLFETFFLHFDLDHQEPKQDTKFDLKSMTKPGLLEAVKAQVLSAYDAKEKEFGVPTLRSIEQYIAMSSLDAHWKEHLLSLDHLREGIGLRGYGQKDPLREYQRESFEIFIDMLERVKVDTVRKLFAIQPARQEVHREVQKPEAPVMFMNRSDGPGDGGPGGGEQKGKKIGRNDPCPCGSGKKYKKCCGRQ
jgi:preprotein translocase subunit SecA